MRRFPRAGIGLALVLASGGCDTGPVPIDYGSDVGAFCRMIIADERYGAELITTKGRILKFDSVECLASYLHSEIDPDDVASLWVTDFSDPPTLIRVEEAFFLHSPNLRSPMGMNLTAFGPGIERSAVSNSFAGELLDWGGVLELVKQGRSHPEHPGS